MVFRLFKISFFVCASLLSGCETLEQWDRELGRELGFPESSRSYYSKPSYMDNSAQQQSLMMQQQADAQALWDIQQQMFNHQQQMYQMQQTFDQQQQMHQQQMNMMSFGYM